MGDERFRFLSEAGLLLVSSLDYTVTLQQVADLSLGILADYCIFDVYEDDRSARRIAWAHRNPKWPRLQEVGRFAPPLNAQHPFSDLVHTGQPLFVPCFDEEWMRRTSWSSGHLELLKELNPHSVMFIPLNAHGRTVGAAIFAFSETPKRHTEADLDLAVDLGRRAGLAVQHSRQYEALQQNAGELARLTDQQRVLIQELNHRVKNTLSIVQAMAGQSMRYASTPAEGFDQFSARIMALARAHDILTRENWAGSDLSELAAQTVEVHQGKGEQRFEIIGEPVHLPPPLTLAMAMTLHELATNAIKYGSLSNDSGKVFIRWQAVADQLTLTWQEVGGPPVQAPTRKGFGSRLIERELRSDYGSSLRYEPTGLVCEVSAKLPAG